MSYKNTIRTKNCENFETWSQKIAHGQMTNEYICSVFANKIIEQIQAYQYETTHETHSFNINMSEDEMKEEIKRIMYSLR